jgi:hypothetical protein
MSGTRGAARASGQASEASEEVWTENSRESLPK